jgi:hypothetical protein
LKGLEVQGYKILTESQRDKAFTFQGLEDSATLPNQDADKSAMERLRGSLGSLSLANLPASQELPAQPKLAPRSSNASQSRLTRMNSSSDISPDGEDAEAKLERLTKLKVAATLGADATIEKLGKTKYRINGQEYTMMVKGEQVTVRKGTAWLTLEKVIGGEISSNPASSRPSASNTPRSTTPSKASAASVANRAPANKAKAPSSYGKAGVVPKSQSLRPPPASSAAKAKPTASRR